MINTYMEDSLYWIEIQEGNLLNCLNWTPSRHVVSDSVQTILQKIF